MTELSDTLLHYTRSRGASAASGEPGQVVTRSPQRSNVFQRQEQEQRQDRGFSDAPQYERQRQKRLFDESLHAFTAPVETTPGHLPIPSSEGLILLQQINFSPPEQQSPARSQQFIQLGRDRYIESAQRTDTSHALTIIDTVDNSTRFSTYTPAPRSKDVADAYTNALLGYPLANAQAETVLFA